MWCLENPLGDDGRSVCACVVATSVVMFGNDKPRDTPQLGNILGVAANSELMYLSSGYSLGCSKV